MILLSCRQQLLKDKCRGPRSLQSSSSVLKVDLFLHSPLTNTSSSWLIGSLIKPPGRCGQAFIKEALSLHLPPQLTNFIPSRPKLIPLVSSVVRIVEGSPSDEERLRKAMEGIDGVVNFLVKSGRHPAATNCPCTGSGIVLIVSHAQSSYSSNTRL